jgi:hypothetical protein
MENLQKDFLHYELALKMKQLGFDEPCLGYWRNEDLPNPITIGQYTTKEDIEYEISGQDEYHNFKNIIALAPLYQQAFRWLYQKLSIENGTMPLNTETQQLLLKELIDKVSSKHLLV